MNILKLVLCRGLCEFVEKALSPGPSVQKTHGVLFLLCSQLGPQVTPDKENPERQKNPLGRENHFCLYVKFTDLLKSFWLSGKPRKAQMSCRQALQEAGKKTRLSGLTSITYPFLGPLPATHPHQVTATGLTNIRTHRMYGSPWAWHLKWLPMKTNPLHRHQSPHPAPSQPN